MLQIHLGMIQITRWVEDGIGLCLVSYLHWVLLASGWVCIVVDVGERSTIKGWQMENRDLFHCPQLRVLLCHVTALLTTVVYAIWPWLWDSEKCFFPWIHRHWFFFSFLDCNATLFLISVIIYVTNSLCSNWFDYGWMWNVSHRLT